MSLSRLLIRFLTLFKSSYTINQTVISMPRGHWLPYVQRVHRLYDRFFPFLAQHIGPGTVVDVGANIGDTALAMLPKCENPFVCVEGSDRFFPYLEKNTRPFRSRVVTKKMLAGTGHVLGELQYSRTSTAHLTVRPGQTATHTPLDAIPELQHGSLSLIKVDADGFDYDVLLSARQIITQHLPLLIWENEINASFQEKGFEELYAWLAQAGYTHLFIFDNFGNILLENTDFVALRNLNKYIAAPDCDRTIYYTDVLAAHPTNLHRAQQAVLQFRQECVGKSTYDVS